MLKPDVDRLDYGALLTPEDGYELDAAIATTYSLDLNALLAVPVALCFHDTLDGDLKGERLALLEAIGQLSGRLKVFYQKGNISFPSRFNRLFTLLEPCLHPIVPDGGAYSSFHPKMWLLRFVESQEGSPGRKQPQVRYRLLVLSRNLTFDRSWDVSVSLDGTLVSRSEAKAKQDASTRQWIGFIAELLDSDPAFAPGKQIKAELARVEWMPPPDTREVALHVGGVAYGRPVALPQEETDEIMVVSPFVKSAEGGIRALDMLASGVPDGERYLFSRAEELDAVGKEALEGWQCFAFNNAIVNGEESNALGDDAKGDGENQIQPQDLHAKLIVEQRGHRARWQLGSANATVAAMGDQNNESPRNIEMMVSFTGAAKKIGPQILREQWMPEKGIQLFEPHVFAESLEPGQMAEQRRLRELSHLLISGEWQLTAARVVETDLFDLTLKAQLAEALPDDVSVMVGQMAIPGEKPFAVSMCWPGAELTKISAFIRVTLTVPTADEPLEQRLLIAAELDMGEEDTRHQVIMRELIDNPEKIMNYIGLLLQIQPDKGLWLAFDAANGQGNGDFILSGNPVLEQLLLAASRHPHLLQRVDMTLARLLKANVEVPKEFMQLWHHFKQVISR